MSVAYADSATQKGAYDDSGANHANVVLLVRFADDTVGDGNTGYNTVKSDAYQVNNIKTDWQYLDRSLNETNTNAYVKQSMREYISYASGGKTDVYNYLPQTNADWTVDYITLGNYNDYANDDAKLLRDAIRQFNNRFSFDGSLADKDHDGNADCVTILLQIPKSYVGAAYRSHQSTAGNAAGGEVFEIGATNAVAIDHYLAIANTSMGAGGGVFSHEFQHSLGARDYYREGTEDESGSGTGVQNPVGIWDIMASSDAKSTPLGITRQDCGWETLNFGSLPASGESKEYTLYTWEAASSDPSKLQSIAFKTPMSDSEYFVVEYREQGAKYTSDWDQRIPGSGVIVYRVNPALFDEGNFKGKDYVYLFREGETGLGDAYSQSVHVPANLSTGGLSEFGSTELSKTITDNAIVYSDGQNSGIKITVKEDGDGRATFAIETADYSSMKFWNTSVNKDGSTPFDNVKASNAYIANDGDVVYMLSEPSDLDDSLFVAKWDGSSWVSMGNVPNLYQPHIVAAGGKVFVGGLDSSGRFRAYAPGDAGGWIGVDSIERSFNEGGLFVVGQKFYAAVSDGSAAGVYELQDSGFKQVGGNVSGSYLIKPTVVPLGSGIGLVVSDFFGSGSSVYALNGDAFTKVGSSAAKAGSISAVTYGGATYVMLGFNNAQAPHFLKLNADGSIGDEMVLGNLGEYSNQGNIALQNGNLMVIGCKDNGKLVVVSAPIEGINDDTVFNQLGEAVLSPAVSGSMSVVGNVVYVSATSDSRTVLKEYETDAPTKEPADELMDISAAGLLRVSDQAYSGTPLTPSATLEFGGKQLVEGVDYILSYSNNNAPGVGIATARGCGEYSGTISTEFTISSAAANRFPDVDSSDWYVSEGWLDYTVANGIMSGLSDGRFDPYGRINRGQVALILYRCATGLSAPESNAPIDSSSFPDVDPSAYYARAIEWCARQGIVTGYTSSGLFGPDDLVTREQLATMIARYVGWSRTGVAVAPAADASAFNALSNANMVSDWARDGMIFCCDAGIIGGVGGTDLAPRDRAWRASMAKMATVAIRDVA